MSERVRSILEKLDRGEMDSEAAIHEIGSEKQQSGNGVQYLRIAVDRLHDEKPQVRVTVPLQLVEMGFSIGSQYIPELYDIDLMQMVDEIKSIGYGPIIEVEDLEEDQHVLISIEST
jgi:hypothetical protein